MKKIGILTFHRAHNYGAQLQCFALQRALQAMGYDVDVIDYRCQSIEDAYKAFPKRSKANVIKSVFSLLADIIKFPQRLHRRKKFIQFISQNLHLSKEKYNNSSKSISSYDVIFIGSDQLWNGQWTGGFDKFYWGSFAHDPNTIVATYAISMGKVDVSEDELQSIKERLTNFDYLSVRESNLKELLHSLTDKTIHEVVDPTLLLDQSQWHKVEAPCSKNGYVLIYPLLDKEDTINQGIRLAKEQNLKYYILDAAIGLKPRLHHLKFVGPSEFLGLIDNASFVVTSSFHGTVFSILYHKPFYSFVNSQKPNVRILNLLDHLELSNRVIDKSSGFSCNNIDYDAVEARKHRMIENSLKYINMVIDSK